MKARIYKIDRGSHDNSVTVEFEFFDLTDKQKELIRDSAISVDFLDVSIRKTEREADAQNPIDLTR